MKDRAGRVYPDQGLKKILIVNLGGMGDLLLSEPAVRALRRAYPASRFAILVTPKVLMVAENMGLFDDLFVFHMGYGGAIPFNRIFQDLALIKKLRNERFDVIINMRTIVSGVSALKMRFLLDAINARLKVGRNTDGAIKFFDMAVFETVDAEKYAMEYDLDTVMLLGAEAEDRIPRIHISDQDSQKIDALLSEKGIEKGDFLVVFHLGGLPSRRWPVENFAALAGEIERLKPCKVLVLAGPGEEVLLRRFQKSAKIEYKTLDKALTYVLLAALIKRARLFVSNDTGPMHLAAVLKTPQVAIFGPGDLVRFDPRNLSDKAAVVYKKPPCGPCYKKECDNIKCLEAVSKDEALGAVKTVLGLI